MQRIAVGMSNPFGEDDVDFDVVALLSEAYNHALAFLREERAVCGGKVPQGILNPLTTAVEVQWARPSHLQEEKGKACDVSRGRKTGFGAKGADDEAFFNKRGNMWGTPRRKPPSLQASGGFSSRKARPSRDINDMV